MSQTLVVGIDLGGTKIAAGVVESSGKLLSKVRVATPAAGVRRDLAALFDSAQLAVAAARIPWRKIGAVGIGVPGAFDPVSETVWAPNLSGWKKVPLRRLLEKCLKRPVFVEADRNVQALAEAWLGKRMRGPGNLVLLTVGTGIGAGIIADGRLISGTRGVAGAAGWLAVSESWRPAYDRIGCLEALSAGPAVARLAREAIGRNTRTLIKALAKSGRVDAETVAFAARRGDRVACHIFEEIGTHLGRGVGDLISMLNPEVVVLAGGLALAGHLLLGPLRREARKWAQPLAWRQVRIVRSRLGEDAGILGAARYALLRMEEKR